MPPHSQIALTVSLDNLLDPSLVDVRLAWIAGRQWWKLRLELGLDRFDRCRHRSRAWGEFHLCGFCLAIGPACYWSRLIVDDFVDLFVRDILFLKIWLTGGRGLVDCHYLGHVEVHIDVGRGGRDAAWGDTEDVGHIVMVW